MIAYHGIPFSGPMESLLALQGKHACVSYEHNDRLHEALELCSSVMLDNGAFSAWVSKRAFDPDGFMAWAERALRHPGCSWALLPDVIDGSEADNDAYLSLASNRHQWVPVYHLHESLDRLERLVGEWPRVAIGSSGEFAQIGTPAWWVRMADVMSIVCDSDGYPLTALHGLRQLDNRVTSCIPYASADSTSVGRNIGIDSAWGNSSYAPKSRRMRAAIMIQRIEEHATAARWIGSVGGWANQELFG